jgi:hypothetical protein
LQFRQFDAPSSAKPITQIARELVDAGIKVESMEIPRNWYAETAANRERRQRRRVAGACWHTRP